MTAAKRRFILYRVYDSAGELLYVGATTNPSLRLQSHSKVQSWWDEAARINIAHFHDFDQLAAAEIEAIESESPRHNEIHSRASAMPWAFKQKRPRGEAGVYLRGDGMWVGNVEMPPGPDGKRRQRRVYSKERKEAVRKLIALRAELDSAGD